MKTLKHIVLFILIVSLSVCCFSCAKDPEPVLLETKTDGDFSFELYGNETITRINVKKGGQSVCILNCNGKDFALKDLNFDGFNDIMLASAEKSDGHYQCFIYQEAVGTFSRNATLDGILYPTLDEETKRIKSTVRSKEIVLEEPEMYKEVRGSAIWEWSGGILTQIYEEGIEYFSGSEIYCVYTSSVTDGVFARNDADDTWYWSYDELVAAGYSFEH